MKLETSLLLLAGQVFNPSHELLTSLDPLEGTLVFGLPDRIWKDHAKDICDRFKGPDLAELKNRGQSGISVFLRPNLSGRKEQRRRGGKSVLHHAMTKEAPYFCDAPDCLRQRSIKPHET
jgi:hypothetical protein